MSVDEAPEVTVLLVNWNSGETLSNALDSLGRQRGVIVSIIVVDNASQDNSLACIQDRRCAPGFELLRLDHNAGYTGGNNAGLRTIQGSTPVLIMNPDARFLSVWSLKSMVDALNEDVAAVGPSFVASDQGPIEYSGTICQPRLALVGKKDFLRYQQLPDDSPLSVPWLDGAMLLLNSRAVKEVGVFDDRFFLFFEEVDWCLRARRLGYQLLMLRSVQVLHVRSTSFGLSPKGTYYYWRNIFLFGFKHGGLLGMGAATVRLCVALGRRRNSGLMLSGFRDAVLGNFGPGPMDKGL